MWDQLLGTNISGSDGLGAAARPPALEGSWTQQLVEECGVVLMATGRSDNGDESNPTVDVAEEEAAEEVDVKDENAAKKVEEEDDEGYTFRFKNGMSPLEFLHKYDSRLQPYQKFECLENQALADKTRKPLSHSHPKGTSPKKAREDDYYDISGVTITEIMELMNHGKRGRTRKLKKRGRRKGSKNKVNPLLTRMLGDATFDFACGRYELAIAVLHEVVRLVPNLPQSYHTLGLVYSSIVDYKSAMDFYMIAAHLTPKYSSLWKMLVTLSIEQGDIGQASYCLSKAITADPKDITLRSHRALLDVEPGDYQNAAVSYEQVQSLS